MNRRSDKIVLTLAAVAGGVGLGLILLPRSGRRTRRWVGGVAGLLERQLEGRMHRISEQLSAETSRLLAEVARELVPLAEAQEDEWEAIYRDLVDELERIPRE